MIIYCHIMKWHRIPNICHIFEKERTQGYQISYSCTNLPESPDSPDSPDPSNSPESPDSSDPPESPESPDTQESPESPNSPESTDQAPARLDLRSSRSEK